MGFCCGSVVVLLWFCCGSVVVLLGSLGVLMGFSRFFCGSVWVLLGSVVVWLIWVERGWVRLGSLCGPVGNGWDLTKVQYMCIYTVQFSRL